MPDAMFQKTFQTFWRFAFKSINDECNNNRLINVHLLGLMYEIRLKTIEIEITSNVDKYEISTDIAINQSLIKFLADHPQLYRLLSRHTKTQINAIVDINYVFKLMSWFLSN